MFITREQWDHITDASSAAFRQEVLSALNRGIKVTIKDAGQPPYREFTRRQQFEAEYRKKLRGQHSD